MLLSRRRLWTQNKLERGFKELSRKSSWCGFICWCTASWNSSCWISEQTSWRHSVLWRSDMAEISRTFHTVIPKSSPQVKASFTPKPVFFKPFNPNNKTVTKVESPTTVLTISSRLWIGWTLSSRRAAGTIGVALLVDGGATWANVGVFFVTLFTPQHSETSKCLELFHVKLIPYSLTITFFNQNHVGWNFGSTFSTKIPATSAMWSLLPQRLLDYWEVEGLPAKEKTWKKHVGKQKTPENTINL